MRRKKLTKEKEEEKERRRKRWRGTTGDAVGCRLKEEEGTERRERKKEEGRAERLGERKRENKCMGDFFGLLGFYIVIPFWA